MPFLGKKVPKIRTKINNTNNCDLTVSDFSLVRAIKGEFDTYKGDFELKVGADLDFEEDNPHRNSEISGPSSNKEGGVNISQDLRDGGLEQF